MTNTVELAKQGDANAIAALMNKSLRAKGVTAEAQRKGNALEVQLYSHRPLNQKTMVDIVQRGMKNLQVASIQKVLVRSANWEAEISLQDSSLPKTSPPTQHMNTTIPDISRSIQSVQNQPAEVSSPVVLLPKLSQVQMSLQQYQDTIIRLTDDTGKKILCLCTLAELIQALHQSTAELTHISQAIEQCSQTNRDGEKIIRNVSILQPGQTWQNTQIRCVLQIFFEMENPINLDVEPKSATSTEEEERADKVIETGQTPSPSDEDTAIDIKDEEATAVEDSQDTVIEPMASQNSGSDDTVIEIQDTLATTAITSQDTTQALEVDPLFPDFNFSLLSPLPTTADLDTLSDPTAVSSPLPDHDFTLEDFRTDFLSMV